MASKNPTLNLVDFRSLAMAPGGHPRFDKDDHFRVDTLKNTIDYRAGQYLTETTVKDLINMGWSINIRRYGDKDF